MQIIPTHTILFFFAGFRSIEIFSLGTTLDIIWATSNAPYDLYILCFIYKLASL